MNNRILFLALGVGLTTGTVALAQSQVTFVGSNITGQLALTRTVNLLQQAQLAQGSSQSAAGLSAPAGGPVEFSGKTIARLPRPNWPQPLVAGGLSSQQALNQQVLTVSPSGSFGFNGLTHSDQRNSNHGNQLSIEPPSPAIAISNGFVLEGVNNAVQVYNTAGTPLLPTAISTNQVFGVAPALNRATGVYGVYPTDMRVFYDPTMDRWIILQRAQNYDSFFNPLPSSRLYMAVSQTSDPTGTYNIYTMNTTDLANPRCPCIADYPQIGADQYGFYISFDEYNSGLGFVDASILAISKAALASGANQPTTIQFLLTNRSGYEFAIQPATTPSGTGYFVASGGVEYFVSSSGFSSGSGLAVWAMTNTSSLGLAGPSLTLIETTVPTLGYATSDPVTQRPGPIPYGSSLFQGIAPIDGGDTRVQSTTYAGGRLWVALATPSLDGFNRVVTSIAYIILSPTFRAGVVSAPVLRQGILLVNKNHLLRPALAVNPQGKGAIVCTLVGPDYYPSVAFVRIDLTSTGSALQIAGAGSGPEDGFSGYILGSARWGDNSAAVADRDGSIWMTGEYIPNLPRTQLANWGTFITRFAP